MREHATGGGREAGDARAAGATDGDGTGGGEASPSECQYCGRRFARGDWLALHRGLEHGGELSPAELAAYESAREAERERLRLFRYKALAALVVLYFGFVLLYALAL